MNIEKQMEELSLLFGQVKDLEAKPTMSRTEARRHASLLAKVALVKEGHSLEDLDAAEVNAAAKRSGIKTRVSANSEERKITQGFQRFIESRDSFTGHPAASYLNGNVGSFVPVEFWNQLFSALKASDPLLDPVIVSYLETSNGRPIQIPTLGDIENVATVVGEGSDQSSNETDPHTPGAKLVGAYSFRSPLWRFSIEAMQDVEAASGIIGLFKQFATDRVSRGASKLLINGNGTNEPLGLITSCISAGISPIVASGSSGNTGGSETGVNSVGSADLAALIYAVDEAYRHDSRCVFLMNDNTRVYLGKLVDKYGRPIMQWQGSDAWILGYRVLTSPSMNSIGSGNIPVLFGNLGYWCTRCVMDNTKIQLVKEAPGLIEQGELGLRLWTRYDGSLLYTDSGSPAPFALLQNQT